MQNADRVLHFFREISAIPRASYDEKHISDYLVDFAKVRGLEWHQDEFNNVIIKKPATIADCSCSPVIIQGHMDMVYVQESGSGAQYEKGLTLIEEDGYLRAKGTTLGADNGIALAYGLALLDSNEIPHPALELVCTVQEEVGLAGAKNLDYSRLAGKYFINLDTEDEGIFYTSCAGAVRNDLVIPIETEKLEDLREISVELSGLAGGHSGMEIQLGRGNAIILLARLLKEVCGRDVRLKSMECQGKMNAIASGAKAVICAKPAKVSKTLAKLKSTVKDFNHELSGFDHVELAAEPGKTGSVRCYTEGSAKKTLSALLLVPNGVFGMSHAMENLVETSSNPGVLEQRGKSLVVSSSVRSSLATRKWEIANKIGAIAELVGGRSICSNDYPQWEFHRVSPLRELAMNEYRELFGKEPEMRAIHAGLECGYFDERLQDCDIVSFGPNIYDVHTPKEKIELQSVENVWKLLQQMLFRLGQEK